MKKIAVILLSAATFVTSLTPAVSASAAASGISSAVNQPVQRQSPSVAAEGVQVAENSWADDRRQRRYMMERRDRYHGDRRWHDRRSDYRDRYDRRYHRRHHHNNAGAIIGGLAAGAIIGGALSAGANRGSSHNEWCYNRYRSYRASDNTYQPTNGPRRQCVSP